MKKNEKEFLLEIHDCIYHIAGNDVELTKKLQKLAFCILATIDGESAFLPSFQLIPDNDDAIPEDISGSLHNNFYKIIE